MTPIADEKKWQSVIGKPGRYRVAKSSDGFWWCIDPDGMPFVYKGVCAVNRAGTQGGRYATPGTYAETCDRIYGDDDDEAFVAVCTRRVRSCGLNAFGAWTTEEFFDRGSCYTEIVEFTKLGPDTQLKGKGIRLPDVFDKKWDSAARKQCEELVTPRVHSPDLFGYFVDNENGWGQPKRDHVWGAGDDVNAGGAHPTLLQFCLALPAERGAHTAAWEFVRKRYGSPADAAAAWGHDFSDPGALRRLTEAGTVFGNTRYGVDHAEFTAIFAERYVRRTSEEIRRIDPDHLILGCRLGAPGGPEITAAHTVDGGFDVLSANNYRDTFYERVEETAGGVDIPILNGEFSWASDYFSKPHSAEDENRTPEELVRRKGPTAVMKACTHPQLIGYTWYRWVHDFDDVDGVAYGLVNRSEDALNRFNASLLAEMNPKLEAVRSEAEATR